MPREQFFLDERGPHEATPMMPKFYEVPPKDKVRYIFTRRLQSQCRLVWMIVLLNGIGVLLPWNMFITIAPDYYVDYWFSPGGNRTDYATTFMSALGMAAQFPNLFINVVNVLLVIGGSLLIRIAGPLVINCISISVTIALIALVSPAKESMGWFYITTLVIVGIINLSNGLYQNSIFGMFADFPAEYSNALVLGNNICGTFTTLVSMGATIVFRDDVRTKALVYFAISLTVLFLCGLSLFFLTRQEFYHYWVEEGNAARSKAAETSSGFRQYLDCFSKCWVQLWNVFFIFFVTLTIFPAMMTATPLYREPILTGDPGSWASIWPENLYVSITTFLCFNVFATVGSLMANFVQFPGPRFLWIPVLLRGLFIPFFMFCNYRPQDRTIPVFFKNEWWFFSGGVLMAITSGYFSSLAMMNAPRVVAPSQAKIAGMTAALCLMLGIFCGVSFTLFIAFLTTTL